MKVKHRVAVKTSDAIRKALWPAVGGRRLGQAATSVCHAVEVYDCLQIRVGSSKIKSRNLSPWTTALIWEILCIAAAQCAPISSNEAALLFCG